MLALRVPQLSVCASRTTASVRGGGPFVELLYAPFCESVSVWVALCFFWSSLARHHVALLVVQQPHATRRHKRS